MYQSILSGAYHGLDCYLVSVEVDVSDGLPCMDMIGYLAGQVKESRERVRVGIKNSGYKIPPKRITISLSPADIRKDGSGFDLPVALGILEITESGTGATESSQVIAFGELGLDGSVKKVSGALPVLLKAAEEGVKYGIVPKGNEDEANMVKEMICLPVASLREAMEVMRLIKEGDQRKILNWSGYKKERKECVDEAPVYKVDFSQVVGQQQARRAAEIAAAGRHNLLLLGPPGSGKSMISERIRTILPPMSYEERLEVSKIKSILGEMGNRKTLVTERPYEEAHPMITPQGLIGGGNVPSPGIITRAHRGVLYMDELPEFGRAKLDMLRQPLEEKKIQIIRNRYVCQYQADFMLVAAMNPCPCGYFPDRSRCRCRSGEIRGYLKRISGALLDRLDISVELLRMDWEQLKHTGAPEESAIIRKRVENAFYRQMDRQRKLNSELTKEEMDEVFQIEDDALKMLKYAYSNKSKSVRGFEKLRRVARTIADLDESDCIKPPHMAEAIVLNGGMERFLEREGMGYGSNE